jgi:hypothetical protein
VQETALSTVSIDEPPIDEAFPENVNPAALADGGLALAGGAGHERALIADGSSARALHWVALPDPLGAPPIGFGKGLLAPGQLGQVFVLDPATGHNLIAPFQPRLSGGETFAWSAPVRLGEQEVLLADGRSTLYRLGVALKPQPNLVALATAELPGPVTAPLVALAKTAYAVDGGGLLRSFELPGLKPGLSWPLDGVQWGPVKVAERALLLTAGGDLLCMDDSQKVAWEIAWPHGLLAGAPLATDAGYVLATVSGSVFRLAVDSGEELAKLDVGEPLGTGPVAVGDRLWLAGHGGTLLVVASP